MELSNKSYDTYSSIVTTFLEIFKNQMKLIVLNYNLYAKESLEILNMEEVTLEKYLKILQSNGLMYN